MSIKKAIEFDGKQAWGYVDIGTETNNDNLNLAKDVFVVLVVGVTGYWKVLIAYFFVTGLSGQEKANIVLESLTRLHEVGVTIASVTSDGPSANFTMFKELGCSISDPHNMITSFPHPSTHKKVFAILDACHMLKLLRNHFESLFKDGFLDPQDNEIRWKYINLLHKKQEDEGLFLACKIKKSHVEFKTQKMKVYLAAQIFSRSTADAIKFLAEDMHLSEFSDSGPTVAFILLVNDMFDILNCRNPVKFGYKGALRENNASSWKPLLEKASSYLLNCKDKLGRPLWNSEKKTPFLGFAITISSICGIFEEFVEKKRLSYLLTYKFSQDHLEMFFCAIRSRNGWNNNPTCLQFMRTIRRILLFSKISGKGGNCRVLDTTTMLTVSSSSSSRVKTSNSKIDIQICRKYELDPSEVALEDHDYSTEHAFIPLTDIIRNVVTYIAGFVLRMMASKSTQCIECLLQCHSAAQNNTDYKLLNRKDRGGLIVPSQAVRDICIASEVGIRKVMAITDNKIPSEENLFTSFTIAISQKFYGDVEELFPNLKQHFLESALDEENHSFILLKTIVYNYTRIRFFNLAKRYTEKIQGKKIRQQLNKLILFKNQ